MPDDADVEVLRDFLLASVSTYALILEQGRLRRTDRRELRRLLDDFTESQLERIVDQYRDVSKVPPRTPLFSEFPFGQRQVLQRRQVKIFSKNVSCGAAFPHGELGTGSSGSRSWRNRFKPFPIDELNSQVRELLGG